MFDGWAVLPPETVQSAPEKAKRGSASARNVSALACALVGVGTLVVPAPASAGTHTYALGSVALHHALSGHGFTVGSLEYEAEGWNGSGSKATCTHLYSYYGLYATKCHADGTAGAWYASGLTVSQTFSAVNVSNNTYTNNPIEECVWGWISASANGEAGNGCPYIHH
jgi:hypothetical protein